MNVERLRAQPDLVSTKNIAQIKEEFNYIPQAEQVAHFFGVILLEIKNQQQRTTISTQIF